MCTVLQLSYDRTGNGLDHFRQNLALAMQSRFGPGHRDKHLAAALKVDRSTINRLRNGPATPSAERLDMLSRFFGVPSQLWLEDPIVFGQSLLRRQDLPSADMRCVAMSSIAANRQSWNASFAIHRGQYVAWWKAHGIDDCYVGSLVAIDGLGENGMRFTMLNPYIRDDADDHEIRCWRYEGVAYPVADYLYVFGEQTDGSYELFTMILTASPVMPPDLLRGCMCGIYVRDGLKQIAVNVAVVLMFTSAAVEDWRSEIGCRLGKVPAARLPDRVRRILDPYPGVIPVA